MKMDAMPGSSIATKTADDEDKEEEKKEENSPLKLAENQSVKPVVTKGDEDDDDLVEIDEDERK